MQLLLSTRLLGWQQKRLDAESDAVDPSLDPQLQEFGYNEDSRWLLLFTGAATIRRCPPRP